MCLPMLPHWPEVPTFDVNRDHMADLVFVKFLHCKSTLSPLFSYCIFWKQVSNYAQITFQEWGVMFPLSEGKNPYKLLRLLHRTFAYSPYSFIYLFIYIN